MLTTTVLDIFADLYIVKDECCNYLVKEDKSIGYFVEIKSHTVFISHHFVYRERQSSKKCVAPGYFQRVANQDITSSAASTSDFRPLEVIQPSVRCHVLLT
jgi:hypothetical protein